MKSPWPRTSGAEACAKATPDGYTICAIYTATTSVNPYVFEKLPYDPARDFAAITRLYYVTGALTAAGGSWNASIVAEVVEISAATSTSLKVNRVSCAIDCYLAVNPGGIQAQLQAVGDAGHGRGLHAAHEATTTTAHRVAAVPISRQPRAAASPGQ